MRWSPDGERFAAALSTGGIQIRNGDTYQIEQVIPTEPNDRLSFAWNPNGQEIAYVDSKGILIVETIRILPTSKPTTVSTLTPRDTQTFTHIPTHTPTNTPTRRGKLDRVLVESR